MKKKNKILGILLSLALVLGMLSGMGLTAYADEDVSYATGYPLWIGDTVVTSLEPTGDGWSYAADTNTLTLSGVNITDGHSDGSNVYGIYYEGTGSPLNIVLSETGNKVDSVDIGIGSIAQPVIFSGKGDISANGTLFGIMAGGYISITGGVITATGGSAGIYSYDDIIISSGTVTGQGEYGIIAGDDDEECLTIEKGASVLATGTKNAIGQTVINEITGTGWEDKEGTEVKVEIEISSTARSLPIYKKVQFPALEYASVTTAPEAKNPTFNGYARDLVTAGEAKGGTMLYVIGTDSSSAPTTGWSADIPEAVDAGTYYVWYMVSGDSEHMDSAAVCVVSKIKNKEEEEEEKSGGTEKQGWAEEADGWHMYDQDGMVKDEWIEYGGYRYYLDESGVMQTGWLYYNDCWYYLYPSGKMAIGWVYDNGIWYFMDSSGKMLTGWVYDYGVWYYLYPSGAMGTGWLLDGDTWYYLYPSGAMGTGWLLDGDTWYYLYPSGKMATGWLLEGNTWYYLQSDGAMATGECLIDGTRYEFDENGAWIG